ncbi:MAG: FadR/GntR family transcriptional regulator [Thermodesulfobacteriota bacterium]
MNSAGAHDHHREKRSHRISKAMQLDILNGLYPTDSRLPSERDLAGQYGVSRVTIREAIEKLERLGMVEKRPNSGSYIRDLPNHASISLLTEIMNNSESVDAGLLIALLDFRQIIEVYAAARAAQKASRNDIAALKQLVADMKRNRLQKAVICGLNVDLHACLIRLSGNLVIQLLFNSFKPVYEYYMEVFHHLPEASEEIIGYYEKLAAAIEAHDDAYAAHLMESLLRHGHNQVKDAAGLSQNGKQIRLRPAAASRRENRKTERTT